MTKQNMQKKSVFAVSVVLLLVLALAGIAVAAIGNSTVSASAADYTYNAEVNTVTWDDTDGLTVVISPDASDLGLYDWALFLFDPQTFASVDYDMATHKLTNSGTMGQNSAAYVFDSNVNAKTGNVTVNYPVDTQSTFKNGNSNHSYTLGDVWGQKDWRVVIGPHHNWGGDSYNCDYYVGLSETITGSSEPAVDLDEDAGIPISFYNYNGSLIEVVNYDGESSIVPPSETVTPDNAWGWELQGWKLNGSETVYNGDQASEWVSENEVACGFTAAYDTNGNDREHITFRADIALLQGETLTNGVIARLIDPAVSNTVTVTYVITHNDGINEILLIPAYDKTAFTLTQANVVPKNDTVLEEATVTGTIVEVDTIKIVWEKNGPKYDVVGDTFLTLTFDVNENAIANGIYDFDLDLAASKAYYDAAGEEIGTHVNVPIHNEHVNSLFVTRIQQPEIVIGYNDREETEYNSNVYVEKYVWEYNKQAVEAAQADSMSYTDAKAELIPSESELLTVYYTYKDTHGDKITPAEGVIDVVWYALDGVVYDEELQTNVDNWVEMQSAPVIPGQYKVAISADANGKYYAVAPVERLIAITNKTIYVDVDDKTTQYGESTAELTKTQIGSICNGDNVTISISTLANSDAEHSVPGTYTIIGTAVVDGANPYYTVIFRRVIENSDPEVGSAVYTITRKEVTLTANDQSVQYNNGNAVELNQGADWYELTGVDATGLTITITNPHGYVEPDFYEGALVPTINLDATLYDVTIVNGDLTIESATKDTTYFRGFFAGDTVTYDSALHDLLIVNENAPEEWWTYVLSGDTKDQTDAGTYNITITVTVKAGYTEFYTIENDSAVFSVTGTINPLAITIKANDAGHVYGGTPVTEYDYTVTSDNQVCEGDTLNVGYVVKDGENTVVLSSETAVKVYDLVISESNNPNYEITLINGDEGGKYAVTKATAQITLTANDVYYNRALDVSATSTFGEAVIAYYSDDTYETAVSVNNLPWNAGTYYVKATVAGTGNYNGSEETATFAILKIKLALPTVSYNGATVTLGNVTTDVDGVALEQSAIVKYFVNAVEGQVYTATTEANGLVYAVNCTETNDNYLPNESNTVAVYSVQFAEGEHPLNNSEPEDMPATMFVFAGQSITIPAAATLHGYTFVSWNGQAVGSSYTPAASVTLPAIWTRGTFTIQFKNLESDEEPIYSYVGQYHDPVTYPTSQVHPTKARQGAISYVFNNQWLYNEMLYGISGSNGTTTVGTSIQGDMTFVAVFVEMENSSLVTYMFSDNESTTAYTQWGTQQAVVYGNVIAYRTHEEGIAWFKVDAWYSDAERTIPAPTTIGDEDITVYGTYKFNIGLGDVNADGLVNANDITLYRQWIVGGYEMTVVAAGQEWATVTDEEFDEDGIYFLRRVADINADNSMDIRDVSITRMSIVGGYAWDKLTGYNVTGQEIVRNAAIVSLEQLENAVTNGNRVTLGAVIEDTDEDVDYEVTGDIYIDLNGKAISVKSFSLTTTGAGATITVLNGTIVTEDGVEIAAPNGNVVLENVTAYDKNGVIALQAASSSLHFLGEVEFIKAEVTAVSNTAVVTIAANTEPEPAPVMVAQGTHVVVEDEADLKVEKIVVYVETIDDQSKVEETIGSKMILKAEHAAVSIDVISEVTTVIEVEADTITTTEDVTNNATKIAANVSNYSELAAAIAAGSEKIKLTGNIDAGSNDIVYSSDVTLDLNGHSITFSSWGIEIRNNTLTINDSVGTGSITAGEACLYAQYAGKLIVNGGTYTSTENFVIGTNGSTGRGNNAITINGGTFNASMTADGQAAGYIACGIYVANSDTVVVNAGTFNVTNGVGILARSGNTTVDAAVVFNVTGDGHLGMVGDSPVTVPAGEVLVLDLAAGYPGGQPTLTNNNAAVVTTINGASTVAQLNAASGYVALTADITTNDTAPIVFTNDVTLILNKHTITSTNDVALRAVGTNAKLTIEGPGSVVAQEACVMAFDGAEFVINGGTFTANDNFVFGTNGTAGRGNNTITINAGTFNGNIQSAGYIACGIYVANNDTVVVNGGTFNIVGGIGILARSGNTTVGENVVINITEKAGLTQGKVGDKVVNITTEKKLVIDLSNPGYPGGQPTLTNNTNYDVYAFFANNNVQKLTYVSTVAELDEARDVEHYIALAGDLIYSGTFSFTTDTVLCLNGHTLGSTNNGALAARGANASLTIYGPGNVNAQEYAVMAFSGAEVVINGGTYTTVDNFVFGTNGTVSQEKGDWGHNTITINAGTFNGNISSAGYVACGVYVANSDTVVVNGGTFNVTNGVGILARSGNTTVGAKVVFNVTGDGHMGKVGDSSVTVPAGKVLVHDLAAAYPGGTPVLTNNNAATVTTINGASTVEQLNAASGYVALKADITTNYDAPIVFTNDVTLILNNHKIKSTNDVALRAVNGATLTIEGPGIVEAQEAAVMAFTGSEIVINGGTFNAIDNFVVGTNGLTGKGNNTITINAGTFNGGITSAGYIACGIYVANNDTVVVNGGTFNITGGIGILARSGNTTVGENVVINIIEKAGLTEGQVGDKVLDITTEKQLVVDMSNPTYPGGLPTLNNNTSYEVYTINAQ